MDILKFIMIIPVIAIPTAIIAMSIILIKSIRLRKDMRKKPKGQESEKHATIQINLTTSEHERYTNFAQHKGKHINNLILELLEREIYNNRK